MRPSAVRGPKTTIAMTPRLSREGIRIAPNLRSLAARVGLIVIVLIMVTLGAARQAIAYSFVTIDYPGADVTQATGINDRGDIVGWAGPPTPPSQPPRGVFGFRLSGATFTPVMVPGASDPGTRASKINNEQQIVGVFGSSPAQGFLFDQGVFTAINVPGETRATDARGINERGTIVGSYATEPVLGRNVGHAYVLDDGIFTSFDVPGLEGPTAYDINNRGVIVGTGSDLTPAHASHGFILEDGVFTILHFPGATLTEALGINDRGQIVGVARIGSPARDTGFLFDRGVFTTIDVPGAL